MIRKGLQTILIVIFTCHFLSSQESFEKASKQISVETGYQYIFKSNFDSINAGGYSMLLDYAWKLSGYNKKKSVYLSVPIGYTYHPSKNQSVSILNYGWTVRHELTKNTKFTPFIGYALLLNQLRYSETEGSIFGHQTKFEFGTNFNMTEKLRLFAKAEYSFSRFPSLGIHESH